MMGGRRVRQERVRKRVGEPERVRKCDGERQSKESEDKVNIERK